MLLKSILLLQTKLPFYLSVSTMANTLISASEKLIMNKPWPKIVVGKMVVNIRHVCCHRRVVLSQDVQVILRLSETDLAFIRPFGLMDWWYNRPQ